MAVYNVVNLNAAKLSQPMDTYLGIMACKH